jgi:hypothetical protein
MPPAGDLDAALATLVAQSLEAWRVGGKVEREPDGALLVTAAGKRLRIARAPADLPLRWLIEVGGHTRGAASVSGLLRHLRAAVDAGYRPVRLRMAPLPPPGARP